MKKNLCGLLLLVLLLTCLPMAVLAADGISFTEGRVEMFMNTTYQMELVRSGAAQEGDVSYTSSARCISVDQNGLLTANDLGGSTITATVKVNNRTYTCTAYVTVNKPVSEIIVTEDGLNIKSSSDPTLAGLLRVPADPNDPILQLPVLVLSVGRDVEFTVNCRPYDATNRKFRMETDNDSVAKMARNNVVHPVDAGECLITAYSLSNPEVSKTYRVLVVKPVTGVNITADSKVVFVGETLKLNAAVTPADATIPDVVWSSEGEAYAVVDQNGVVTGVKPGQVSIRATAADGSKRYFRYTVNVQQKPQSVTLDQDELNLSVGNGRSLRATVLPNNTSDKSVVWTSSDDRIAKVNQNGYITPVSRGTCVITCASKVCPDVYAEAYINVIQPLTRIQFNPNTVTVSVGSAAALYWTTEPANATDNSVTLTSSNNNIAMVDQNGYVYGMKRGECTITAKANDGSGKTARVTVKVTQPVTGVHMKNDTVAVGVHESATINAVMEPSDASNNRMSWYSADPRIATVSGTTNSPRVTGQAWGSTVVYGTTEDGGYTTSCMVRVGNYDRALTITDLYLLNNAVKMVVRNDSDMNITYFTFTVELYDWQGNPVACNPNGSNVIYGSHSYTLYEGESTQHGRFSFGEFYQPETQLAKLVMRITSYRTDDGYRRNIAENKQPTFVYESPIYVTPTPGPTGEPTVKPTGKPDVTSTPKPSQKPTPTLAPDIPVINVHPDKNNGKYSYAAVLPVGLTIDETNRVRVTLQNFYKQSMQRVYMEVELYDANDNPIMCGKKEQTNIINAYNGHKLEPGAQTKRGTFDFVDFAQPSTPIAYALVRVTAFLTMTDEKVYIPAEYQPMMEYRSEQYTGKGHVPEFVKLEDK